MNAAARVTSPSSATDHDLATDAAHGAAGAFESLYRRHGEAAWRLAHATAPSADDAATATTDGFVRALRDVRRDHDSAAMRFRSHLLSAVYRAAITGGQAQAEHRHHARSRATAPLSTGDANRRPQQHAASAYRQLPERWRAALWLIDVEGLAASDAASVMGVSSPAVVQLNKRGHAGLNHRMGRSGIPTPVPELAATLEGSVPPVPPALAASTEAKWKKAMASERRRATPAAGWLIERAPTPLAACAVGICAAGIIGAALMSQGTGPNRAVPAGQIASPPPAGAIPPPTGSVGTGAGPTVTTLPPSVSLVPATAGAQPIGAATAHVVGVVTVTTTDSPGVEPAVSIPPPTIAPPPVAGPVGPTTPGPTVPPTTAPTIPLPTIPLPTLPPAAQPVAQASINVAPVAQVNVGLGAGSCTGVSVLGVGTGCTTPTASPLGLTVLGRPILP